MATDQTRFFLEIQVIGFDRSRGVYGVGVGV